MFPEDAPKYPNHFGEQPFPGKTQAQHVKNAKMNLDLKAQGPKLETPHPQTTIIQGITVRTGPPKFKTVCGYVEEIKRRYRKVDTMAKIVNRCYHDYGTIPGGDTIRAALKVLEYSKCQARSERVAQ